MTLQGETTITFDSLTTDANLTISEPAETTGDMGTDEMGRSWTLQILDKNTDNRTEIKITEEQAEKMRGQL